MMEQVRVADEVGEVGIAPSAVMARFIQIHRHLSRYSRRVMEDFGISGRTLAALRYLKTSGEATIGQLSQHLVIRNSSASEMVTKMEDRGLVQRVRCQVDNRVVKVSLTPGGEDILARAPLEGFGLLRDRLASLEADELLQIGSVLDRIAELLNLDANGKHAK